jgi:pseudaminic acid cytidylyltransferase
MNIAVIPARGGSKRIPRKNVKSFCGKPMIAWPIEAAIGSGCFDQVVVSTDDEEIAKIAQQHGAVVPFVRPSDLSGDYTGTTAVVIHAIEWFQQQGITLDMVCCLYATAPLVQIEDLQSGEQLLKSSDADFAFSVTNYAFPVQRAVRITEKGRVEMLNQDFFATRSQDLEEVFHDAGQFYWGRTDAWVDGKFSFGSNSIPVVLPRYRVQDIDAPEDWKIAEYMFEMVRKEKQK